MFDSVRYFDHAASSPLRDEVRAAMAALPPLANPGSTHRAGQYAAGLYEEARERVAERLGAHPTEVIFTSGGTESINLALKGSWWASKRSGIVVPLAEHSATIDAAEWLEQQGASLRWVGVDEYSRTDVDAFASALPGASLATALHTNNETGALQPVTALAEAARTAGVPLHLDAVAAGASPIDFRTLGVAMLSYAAHKVGGPLGIGALLVARSHTPTALVHGGGQQRALRSGTADVAAAIGFAVALETAANERAAHAARFERWSAEITAAAAAIDGVRVSVPASLRAQAVVHLLVDGVDAETLVYLMDAQGLQVSNGAACTAGVVQTSHVVEAMGQGGAPLRISLGWSNTDGDVQALVDALPRVVAQARIAR